MDPKPIEAFGTSLQEYYNNKCLSDVVIRCEGQEFAVHSLVIFCHSDYFKKQLTGPWKESQDKIIEITDFEANIVEAMLRFVYSFDYHVPPNTPPMIFHAKVYQIGDKYGIETLKKQALNNFKRVVESAEVTTEYASDLADAVTTVYTTTPPEDRGLRDIVMNSSYWRLRQLITIESFKESLPMNGDFSTDLLKAITSRSGQGEIHTCSCYMCKTKFTMRIDSLADNASFLCGPCPVRCPVCAWGPQPSYSLEGWLYYFRQDPNSVVKQGDGRRFMDLLQ
ncbi:uncharacterized protein FMAN_13250 [Fusarium mangiferae]|uniref:BTB domain-containing protein n=1 Tax=Fusarium mangiferae TaxID=192010 RepID=A0A1L7TJL2_FUSMA|nr:uncharacterized protein FMAN_13250 [Fusarium mangiferae]CVK94996.1 uncharacterized protein FMAN_13250 [Fusarium mangiferae]